MNADPRPPAAVLPAKRLSVFERYLTVWVFLCMVAGVSIGTFAPGVTGAVRKLEFGAGSQINVAIAVLIWLMVYPMMLKIDLGSLAGVGRRPKGLLVTLFVNWLVKPFSMALLAWLFFKQVFAGLIPPELANQYIAGAIILAAAPCTAMVFVWSNLSDGEPNFTLSQVALNDTIMLFAFAPIVALLLGLSSIIVPGETLALSVVLYIVVPVIVSQLWRRRLLAGGGPARLSAVLARLHPISLGALLLTLVLLFSFQGRQILAQPLVIAMLAVPILIQVYFNAGLAYWLNR
jgi:arsenite transporter